MIEPSLLWPHGRLYTDSATRPTNERACVHDHSILSVSINSMSTHMNCSWWYRPPLALYQFLVSQIKSGFLGDMAFDYWTNHIKSSQDTECGLHLTFAWSHVFTMTCKDFHTVDLHGVPKIKMGACTYSIIYSFMSPQHEQCQVNPHSHTQSSPVLKPTCFLLTGIQPVGY